MRLGRLARAAVLTAALAACGPGIDGGEILEKHFEPAHTTWEYGYTCGFGIGGEETCDNKFHWVYYSDEWTLLIKDCDPIGENGMCQVGWVEVEPETYGAYEVGDEVTFE